MTLPNIENLLVSREKIVDYLLSLEHRDGRSKAKFFARFGFSSDNWQVMARALELHAREHKVQRIESSPFGKRYVIEGPLQCPDGRRPNIRTVWFINIDQETPRFVTAYPLTRGKEK